MTLASYSPVPMDANASDTCFRCGLPGPEIGPISDLSGRDHWFHDDCYRKFHICERGDGCVSGGVALDTLHGQGVVAREEFPEGPIGPEPPRRASFHATCWEYEIAEQERVVGNPVVWVRA